MLALCDRYPLRKNFKGGSVMTNIRRVWITSNDNPLTWWPNKGFEPFARRVSGESGQIIHQITPWVSTVDGELLVADVEEAYKKMEEVARNVATTMQQLDDLLPADHPQKKRRLEPRFIIQGGPATQVGVNYPTNWYDADGNDKLN